MRKTKFFVLLSGNGEKWHWAINCGIRENSVFKTKGEFCFQNNQNRPREYAENAKTYLEEYRKRNKEKIANWHRSNYKTNRIRILKRCKVYDAMHRKRKNTCRREWRKTSNGILSDTKSNSKHRQLGFIPINEPFDGGEGHHLDTHFVVYIHKEIHRSIPHNVWSGKNMQAINEAAMDSLFSERK